MDWKSIVIVWRHFRQHRFRFYWINLGNKKNLNWILVIFWWLSAAGLAWLLFYWIFDWLIPNHRVSFCHLNIVERSWVWPWDARLYDLYDARSYLINVYLLSYLKLCLHRHCPFFFPIFIRYMQSCRLQTPSTSHSYAYHQLSSDFAFFCKITQFVFVFRPIYF